MQIGPAVENLVENAAEHNPEPTPTVRVSVSLDGDADEAVVTVRDDGPGLPPIERRTLEADHETALVHAGGLGLWIARWGARAAGGDVAFHDRADGTEVVVRVPVASE
ncbi:ATP-binding protein [Halarchaeum acidiphilum]|uniref:ATP-binding protein n=1 Tax=Halarchaeum acidiphilum TaxID=489138 RepID=UPI000363B7F1|nr:ATP-binding protein [Halarchaeum acidiphilum]